MVSKEKYMTFIREMLKEEDAKKEDFLNQQRKTNKTLGTVMTILFFIIVLPFFLINFAVGIVAFFVWLIVVANSKAPSTRSLAYYKKEYRTRAIDFLLKGSEYTFNPESSISYGILDDSQLFGLYDDAVCEDRLSINIANDDNSKSNCYLNLCDLKLTRQEERTVNDFHHNHGHFHSHIHHTRKEIVDVPVYKGMFGYVEFPFEFRCLLCLNTRYKKKDAVLSIVKLEDIVFSKKFGVLSNDQVESRYILTPDMMEKLLQLYSKFKGLRITLVDNKMYIASSATNLFEFSGTKAKPETLFERLYDDVNAILALVNEIKNNNKIFRM